MKTTQPRKLEIARGRRLFKVSIRCQVGNCAKSQDAILPGCCSVRCLSERTNSAMSWTRKARRFEALILITARSVLKTMLLSLKL